MDGHSIQNQQRSLSLILPAYNEEAGILRAVEEADETLAGLGYRYEVLVVDDGSRDETAAVVTKAAANRPAVRLLRHAQNKGYGAALRTGFEAARFDRVAFTDADCQFDLTDLASLTSHTDHHPMAVGIRLDRQDPWHRRFYSWGYNVLVRTLLGTRVRDCDCALKVFRKDALAHLLPESRGFFVNAEMLTKARQMSYTFVETGVTHRPRALGSSKVSILDVPRVLRTLIPFWWSRVLFPENRCQASGVRDRGTGPWALILVVAVAALLFFSRLRTPLLEPEEARYAEIPRQMLVEGRWLVPVLHGQPYYQKPPLLYWLVIVSYKIFGVHDWAARLVPCAAGFLTVVGCYLWSKRILGWRPALAGALMLCLSARFVYQGRMLTMDSLLALWTVMAWGLGYLAYRGSRFGWSWWLASALACGLGILTKGPVALALVIFPLWLYQWLEPRAARGGGKSWASYLTLACAVAFPWYTWMAYSDPQGFGEFFWMHNVLRYVAPFDHEEPFWFYVPALLLGMLPWTLLLLPLLKVLGPRSGPIARRRPACLGFILLAFLWCLAFYSASGCKRPGYILPAMPPLALALGCCFDLTLPRSYRRRVGDLISRARQNLPYRATLLVLAGGIVVSLLAMKAELLSPIQGLPLMVVAGGALAYFLRRGPRPRVMIAWGVCAAAMFAMLLLCVNQILPGYARKFSLRASVKHQLDLSADPRVPVVCYPHRWDSVSYYLQRDDVRVYSAEQRPELIAALRSQPRTVVFVKSDHSLKELLRDLPGSLEFVERSRHGIVTAGVVCRREEAAQMLVAQGP